LKEERDQPEDGHYIDAVRPDRQFIYEVYRYKRIHPWALSIQPSLKAIGGKSSQTDVH